MAANQVLQVKYRQVTGAYGGKPLGQFGDRIAYVISAATDYNSIVAKLASNGITPNSGAVIDVIHVAPALTPVSFGNPADGFIWRCTWHREISGKPIPGSEQSADFFAVQQGGGNSLTGGGRPDPAALLTVIAAEFPGGGTIVVTRASSGTTGGALN
jgi:hypothetical protein